MKQELIIKKEELPEGWRWRTIEKVCKTKPTSGGTPLSSNPEYYGGNIPWVITEDLTNAGKYISSTQKKVTSIGLENSNAKYFPEGTILFAMYGSIGRMSISKVRLTTNQAILGLIPDKTQILTEYLYYYLNFTKEILIRKGRGGTQSNVNAGMICNFPILIPPLSEQQKIVSKLDIQMAQIEVMKKEAEKELYSIKELIPSSLQKLFHIKVPLKSNKSQKTSNPPNEWKWVKLIDIAKLESGHTPSKTIDSYWVGGDVPWISLQDIKNFEGDYINDTIDHPTMEGIKNSSARILPKDTVVLSRDASIGHVIIMKRDMATTQHFVNYICSDKIKSLFLLYLLRASKIEFDRLKEGAIIKTLYMPLIKSFEIMLPPLNVQDEIIVRMKKIYEYQKILQTESENKLNAISQLPSSILNEVFGQYEIPEEV